MTLDNVKAKNFYQDDGDKTLLNWCLYEYANILYTKIKESHDLANYRKNRCGNEIETFCVYFSKNTHRQTQRLLDAALSAWNEHVSICSNCPNQCLKRSYDLTDMFDNLETVGWPQRHNQQE